MFVIAIIALMLFDKFKGIFQHETTRQHLDKITIDTLE